VDGSVTGRIERRRNAASRTLQLTTTMNMKTSIWLAALAIIGAAATAFAQVPGIIQYQGRVTSNGTNFSGTGQFKFAIIETTITGDSLWSNDGSSVMGSQPTKFAAVPVQDGLFIVGLGDNLLANMMTIPASIFSYQSLKLRIWFSDGVGPFAALSPDQPITSVGFAMMSAGVAPNSINATLLLDGAVTAGKIAPDAVAGVNLLNQTITGSKIVPNSITSTQLADATTLQQLDLGGPLWNGSLNLFASGANEARGLLVGDSSGSHLNLQFLNNSTGAILSARSPGAKLNLWDALGNQTTLLGAGTGGGELSLFQLNGQVGVFLDGDKSICGNGNSSGGEIEVRTAGGQVGLLLDGDHNSAGRVQVRQSDGTTTAELLGARTSTTGGRLTLREADGTTSVVVDGENGLNGGARVALTTGGGATTFELEGAETSTTGSLLNMRQANSTVTVKLDAESGGAGGGSRLDLYAGDGMSKMVFLPGGGDATLAGGGLMRLGDFNGANLGIDDNEILARNNGNAAPL